MKRGRESPRSVQRHNSARAVAFGFLLPLLASTAEPQTPMPLYDDLGSHHHAITTDVPLAQHYFDQGLRFVYAFNHAEAIASLLEAARLDPSCAMCYWGIALAYGPNINAAMDSATGLQAFEAIQKALARAEHVTPKEQAYIRALAKRYAAAPPADRASLDSAYAIAMRQVADRYPDDPDAQVLHAEALMLLSPWNYWAADKTPRPGTDRLLSRLRSVIQRHLEHAGGCHFYIHAVEAAHPERAIACAERLPALMPGAGHVVHMPAHIYIRVGRYADAIEANVHAVHEDEAYIADRNPQGVYPLAYYPHNYHFLSFAAAMAGQSVMALDAARKLVSKVDRDMMREPGLGALQHYLVAPLRVLVRFGKWEAILEEPAPPEDLHYPKGVWHWARGLAFVRRGELERAQVELERLQRMVADPAIEAVTVWELNSAAALLAIAERLLTGELAAARGDYDAALRPLGEAAELEDDLVYDEPPDWELPTRDFLGAALLEAGRSAEAERVFREALDRFPDNGWALIGLKQALEVQGKTFEALQLQEQFDRAWAAADVKLAAPRF